MKNRFLTIFVIIVSMLALAGCSGSKPWFTPHSPHIGVKEQWQIQGFHLSVDSPEQFTFDIGLAEKSPDYSFWQHKLSWQEISTIKAQTLFGKTTIEKLLLGNTASKNPILYDLMIPNTLDTMMPATKLGYGNGDPKNLVDSIVSLHEGDTEHIVIIANNPIQWTDTSVDPKAQIVSFTWLLSKPNASALSLDNKIQSSTIDNGNSDSSSIRLTGSNLPDWFMNDLKLASEVNFPTIEDGYAWNRNMSDIQNNYFNRIKGLNYWLGNNGQLWIGGYTGTKTVSSYSTYAGPFNMKEVYQMAKNPSNDNNDYWGSLTPVLLFESDKMNFVPVMSWDRANSIWIAFAPDQVIIKSSHAAVDTYEVYNVPGIKIPTV